MNTATDVLIYLSALAAYGFVFRFLLTTWFRTVVGRIVMAVAVAVLLIFTLVLLSTVWGQDYPYRTAIRFTGYLITTLVLWWALAVLWVDQRRTRRRTTDAQN
jgi:hypothetical protein